MSSAVLIDTTLCIGCRSCQVSCKQWNGLPAEQTHLPEQNLALQNPKVLSAKTFALIQQHELPDNNSTTGFRTIFVKRQCMHCEDPACAAACPVTAMHKTKEGPVIYDSSKCLGCRYCMWACPWGVPTAEWDSLAPKISKCDMCYSRIHQKTPAVRNGEQQAAGGDSIYHECMSEPACVKQCPAGALRHGTREEMLAEAKRRITANPDKYVNYIYGEHEAGGTNTFYLAAVPFEQLGFPRVQTEPLPHLSAIALGVVPPAVIGVGALLGGTYKLGQRKAKVAASESNFAARQTSPTANFTNSKDFLHPHFAPVPHPLWTPMNKLLGVLMGLGGLAFLLRFVLGLGGATNLSDTHAWGLWIIFDLVWIAVAAGAFATAGLIYILHRDDLYSIGRAAVLMGLLSYSFVTVTLLADLGLPWHFYELALNAPKHSAMFEVSWCVGLYVTILLLEFLPIPFERFGLKRYANLWTRYAPVYVAVAMTLFVYLLSRKLLWTVLAAVVFGLLAYAFRTKEGEKPIPVMLAIAAVTFSTMHQSSLGSLFLLMPEKLNHLWWSPIMSISFFLSSIAAGTSLMVLIEMWIAKVWNRPLHIAQTASLGKIAFCAMLIYQIVRLGDLIVRGQLSIQVGGSKTGLFLAEVLLGGFLPLVLLSTDGLRRNPKILGIGAFLGTAGIIFNRINVVAFAMNLRGPLPQTTPSHYFPSAVEWMISIGLISATIFLFGCGVRYLPVLPKEQNS